MKKSKKLKKKNNVISLFHVPSAKSSAEQTKARQLISCLDKIEEAKKNGNTSCYLLGGDHGYLVQEVEDLLLEKGYDLRMKYFSHNHSYFLLAIWDSKASGKFIIEK